MLLPAVFISVRHGEQYGVALFDAHEAFGVLTFLLRNKYHKPLRRSIICRSLDALSLPRLDEIIVTGDNPIVIFRHRDSAELALPTDVARASNHPNVSSPAFGQWNGGIGLPSSYSRHRADTRINLFAKNRLGVNNQRSCPSGGKLDDKHYCPEIMVTIVRSDEIRWRNEGMPDVTPSHSTTTYLQRTLLSHFSEAEETTCASKLTFVSAHGAAILSLLQSQIFQWSIKYGNRGGMRLCFAPAHSY